MNTRDESEFVVVVVKNRDSGRFDNIVTMLPHDHVRERGLVPEAMVGSLTVSLGDGGTIEPSNFVENPAFVDYLQRFIAGHAVPTRDDVSADDLVQRMKPRPVVGIGDGSGQVETRSVGHG